MVFLKFTNFFQLVLRLLRQWHPSPKILTAGTDGKVGQFQGTKADLHLTVNTLLVHTSLNKVAMLQINPPSYHFYQTWLIWLSNRLKKSQICKENDIKTSCQKRRLIYSSYWAHCQFLKSYLDPQRRGISVSVRLMQCSDSIMRLHSSLSQGIKSAKSLYPSVHC